MHFSTTNGIGDFLAFITVVRSCPNTDFTNFISGMQSGGTFSEHFLWASKPQSEKKTVKMVKSTIYFTLTEGTIYDNLKKSSLAGTDQDVSLFVRWGEIGVPGKDPPV